MKSRVISAHMVVALILVLFHKPVFSQNFNWFSYERNNQPYIAEMHSPSVKLELVNINKFHPFYYKNNPDERPFIEVQMGYQLPVLTYEKQGEQGRFQVSFYTPVSVLTLVDMFESVTAPVINNDYRFGANILFLFAPEKSKNGFVKNYHIRLVPMFHESTHIGDEFALHGYEQIPDFSRINVSYEAWQIIAGINRYRNDQKNNLSAEIGYQRLMPYKEGYYNIDSLEVKGGDITLSESRDLWFARAEYYHSLKSENGTSTELVASTEVRRETKFGYTLDDPEKRVWSMNFYLGCRFPIKNSQKQFGMYYRYYRGIVPYGQFRDANGFVLHGISLIVN